MEITDQREDPPLISVVLPSYNRPKKVLEAVESVANQTYSNTELIIVDDASSTPVREILQNHTFDNLQWRCIRHEFNRGANSARNTGIEEANGKLISFLDDDDYWLPETLAVYSSLFQKGGEAVGVALITQMYEFEGEVTSIRVPQTEGDATRRLLEGKAAGTFSAIAVRQSVIDTVGLPDENLPSWQDREWLIRLSRHCQFAIDSRPFVVRRSGNHPQIADNYEAQRDVSYPLFLKKHLGLAIEFGCEEEFIASLTRNLAGNALRKNYTEDARKFATKSVRFNPQNRLAWTYLGLSFTGPRFYDYITQMKRRIVQYGNRFSLTS